ncbi:hypothetical protein [Bradyrhizobium sp.]|uniref:hypothetical protein n=1 Tax=Bradyrhizobium sp. TaxID=376 RepID=UPI0039E49A95
MAPEVAAEADVSTERQKPDLLGIACLATMGIVTVAWIGFLIWGASAVLSWLTS